MKTEIVQKLKELHTLLENGIGKQNACLIIGDHPDECNIIGSEESYLNLINCIVRLLLVNQDILKKNDDFDTEDNELSSSEIKQGISEYSDYWPVCMILQSGEKFKTTYENKQSSFN